MMVRATAYYISMFVAMAAAVGAVACFGAALYQAGREDARAHTVVISQEGDLWMEHPGGCQWYHDRQFCAHDNRENLLNLPLVENKPVGVLRHDATLPEVCIADHRLWGARIGTNGSVMCDVTDSGAR